jgi:glycosyltransferase involved in cell wall biosynthesis
VREEFGSFEQVDMRILVDGRWVGEHGIGRYASEVIPRLSGNGTVLEELGSLPLLHPLEPLWLSWKILHLNPDVYFSPGFNPPVWSSTPFVFMVHDLIHLRFAESYGWKQRAYYRTVVRPSTQCASAILTNSEFSKGEILNWTNVPESKIRVVWAGVGEQFDTNVEPLTLPYPYLLYVGNRKSHKNLPRLLEAFALVSSDSEVRLVLTGAADAATSGLVSSLELTERVVFFGPVSDKVLPKLYRGAIALVFPSLIEGFGLPPLEAMACGTPVIASNTSSIPEVVGDAAVMVDPYKVEALADAMWRVLSDAGLRAAMSARGLERAKLFSWDKTARLVLQTLREVAGRANEK